MSIPSPTAEDRAVAAEKQLAEHQASYTHFKMHRESPTLTGAICKWHDEIVELKAELADLRQSDRDSALLLGLGWRDLMHLGTPEKILQAQLANVVGSLAIAEAEVVRLQSRLKQIEKARSPNFLAAHGDSSAIPEPEEDCKRKP